jgi:signal transducing adaptor molecule
VFDPNGTYADTNVQAWARYYAQGGKDLAGAVYFISIPGVTDGAAQPGASPTMQSSQPATAAQVVQQPQPQPQPSAELPSSGEVVGHPSQQTQSGSVPQARPPIQTTQPVNGHRVSGPTSPYAMNVPWAQATGSPPSSPSQQNPVTPYHQPTTSGSPPPSTFSAQGSTALQSIQSVPLQSQFPLAGTYSESGPESAHVRSGSDTLGAAGESSVPGYPQYNSLPSQFGGMKVGDDGNQPLLGGQQQVHQASQGVGLPA